MKKIYLGLLLIFTSFVSSAQTSYQKGVIRGTNSDNTSITKMVFDNYDYQIMFGKFRDSVHMQPFSSGATLFGGSSATGVHNAFFAVYDAGGSLYFAHKLGNTTDSVTIKGAAFDNSGNVVIGGSFKGTVDFADNAGSPVYLTSLGTSSNGFVAFFDYNGNFVNAALLENSTGFSQVNDVVVAGTGEVIAVGQFTGTVDLDPSGATANYTATATDGFVVNYGYQMSGYYSSAAFDGAGNQIPTFIGANFSDLIIGGIFDNQIDLDLGVGVNTATSNGGKDLFMMYTDYTYVVSNSVSIGGAGNDRLKDLIHSPSQGYYALIDFEQTVNFDPAFGSTNLTASRQSDVAIARYFNDFSLGYVKQFGNSNADKGYRIVMNSGPGGGRGTRGGPPVGPYPEDDFMFTMSFSGTVDFNPEPTESANSSSSNTLVNSAVINLDSSGTYLFHGTIEAESILGYKPTGTSGNNIIMAGNFAGTDVDMLVYSDTSSLSHSGIKSGYYMHYNRCNLTHQTPEIVEPFECTGCNAKLQMQVSGGVEPYEYYWSNGDYYSYSEVAMDVCADNSNRYDVYVTDFYGCGLGDTLWVRNHNAGAELDAVLNVVSTSCGNNFGSASVTPVNALGSVSYNWSSGSISADADSLIAGSYFMTLTDDSLFCYVEKSFSIDNSNGPVITVNSSVDPACGNIDNGTVDVTVTGGASPYTFLWSNGATTEDLSGVGGGTYSLIVTDATGCENTACASLYQPSEINTYTTTSYYSSCNFNDGMLTVASSGGFSPYTYQWDANAGSVANDTVYNLFAGMYSVTVTDSLGCTADFDFGVSDGGWWTPYVTYNYITYPNCLGTTGFIDVYSQANSTLGILTYQWNTGETTEDITAESGMHLLQATDDDGCRTVTSFWVSQELPNPPTVCMVTVDSTGTQNVVVWDKSTTQEAAYYNIYREGYCNQSDFGIVGSMPFDSLSAFYDTVVNSDTRTWRYYVTAVDTCGFESNGSEIHRTIHLTSIVDVDTNIALDWSDYVGMDILGYKIYRKQPAGILYDLVDSVGEFTTNYLDTIDFDPYPEVEYFVEAIPAMVCNATRAYNQNEARSNHSKNVAPKDTSTLAVSEIGMETSFELYPNPSNDQVNLKVKSDDKAWTLELLDQTGRIVMSRRLNNQTSFSTKEISAGVYFIRMTSDENEIHTMKLMIAH